MLVDYRSIFHVSDKEDAPDVFVSEQGLEALPPDSFVISRKKNGEVLSRFGDMVWDLSSYRTTTRGQYKIFFSTFGEKARLNERTVVGAKKILFLILYAPTKKGLAGIGAATLVNYAAVLRALAKFAEDESCEMTDVLTNPATLKRLVKTRPPRNVIARLLALMARLRFIGTANTGLMLVDVKHQETLKKIDAELRLLTKQTLVIPSKIYVDTVNVLSRHIERFNAYSSQLIELIKVMTINPSIGRCKSSQRHHGLKRDTYEMEFPELTVSLGLGEYFASYEINSIDSFSSHISGLQTVSKCLIVAYSGMRSSEADSLTESCLEIEKTLTGTVFKICGKTSKLARVSKKARWITCDRVEPVIAFARNLASCIVAHTHHQSVDKPLFPATTYLPFVRVSPKCDSVNIAPSALHITEKWLKTYLGDIRITPEDIKELRRIEPFRDWENESQFEIGKAWPLAYHQFRRSLAVYAAQSGLVSLPSLKRQLKHITREMTLYYAKGAPDAEALFGGDLDHIRHEFERVKPEADALAYLYDILLSEESLKGGHGQWIERHVKQVGKETILASREDTIRRFRNGELAFKETPLGGCTTTVPCHKKPLRAVSACLDCHKSIIKPTKVAKVIDAQKRLLASLDNESMVYRMEKEQLNDLERFAERSF